MRALLALPRRCRQRSGTPDALRALRVESVRFGRTARVCVNGERMQPAAKPQSARRWARWLWVSAIVIAADQATKAAILATIREGDGFAVTPFFSLVLTFNTGAAFSFLSAASGWQRWFFVAIAVVAAAVILVLLKRGGSAWY